MTVVQRDVRSGPCSLQRDLRQVASPSDRSVGDRNAGTSTVSRSGALFKLSSGQRPTSMSTCKLPPCTDLLKKTLNVPSHRRGQVLLAPQFPEKILRPPRRGRSRTGTSHSRAALERVQGVRWRATRGSPPLRAAAPSSAAPARPGSGCRWCPRRRGPRLLHGLAQQGQGFLGLSRFDLSARRIHRLTDGDLTVFATFGGRARQRGGRSILAGSRFVRTRAGQRHGEHVRGGSSQHGNPLEMPRREASPPSGPSQLSRLVPNAPVMPSYSKMPPASSWPGP